MYTWSDIALVLTSKGNPDKQQHSAVIVSPTGDTTPVDVPPWYGRNVSGTYTSESGRLVTATIDCDGERSEDNGACTTNAVLTVWVSDDARKWSILSQAELEGTMDKAYVGGELIEFSDDGDSATVLVTTYGEDKLIKQRPDGSVEIPIDENVETLCATPNGIVAQVADSASEQQTEMTTPRKGLADPVVENTGPLIRFDEAGEVVARSGNRLPSGRLLCGVSGRAYTDSGATMSISEIRTSDLSIGETMARYEEFGGHYVDVPGRGFVVVNESESEVDGEFVQMIRASFCDYETCMTTFERTGSISQEGWLALGDVAATKSGTFLTLVDVKTPTDSVVYLPHPPR